MPPPLSMEDQQAEIILEAWRCLHEATTEGQITLKNGRIITPANEAWGPQLQLLRQMAALKPPKQRMTTTSDDWVPQETRTQKDQAYGSNS